TVGYLLLSGASYRAGFFSSESLDFATNLGILMASLVFALLAVLILGTVQHSLNAYWQKEQPGLLVRSNFTRGEIVLLAIGTIVRVAALVGVFAT
ncbi:MAG TPA: hypothetical protein VFM39_07765, partial [bacterium]|nr:hypothetical protein [bacterium]